MRTGSAITIGARGPVSGSTSEPSPSSASGLTSTPSRSTNPRTTTHVPRTPAGCMPAVTTRMPPSPSESPSSSASSSSRSECACCSSLPRRHFPEGHRNSSTKAWSTVSRVSLAFHVDPSLATGRIGSRSGPITASADKFTLVLDGPGGHTARPHRTVDLIADAARLVHEFPGVLRRTVDARSPFTIAFGSIHGGTTAQRDPNPGRDAGDRTHTGRSLWGLLPGLVDKAIGSLMAWSDASYTLDYCQAIPPVVNDDAVVDAATSGISELLGPDIVVPTEPSWAARTSPTI